MSAILQDVATAYLGRQQSTRVANNAPVGILAGVELQRSGAASSPIDVQPQTFPGSTGCSFIPS